MNKNIILLSTILLLTLLNTIDCNLIRNHEYWYTGLKKYVKKGIGAAESGWMYCDLKCLYFEHYYPGYDFVYINFAQTGRPNFAACYIRKVTSSGATSYSLWNTVVKNNTFYNLYCGQ